MQQLPDKHSSARLSLGGAKLSKGRDSWAVWCQARGQMESLGNKRQVGVCLVVAITVISMTGWCVPPCLMKRKQKHVVKGHRYQSGQLLKPLQNATFVPLPNYQCCLQELKGGRVCGECVWSRPTRQLRFATRKHSCERKKNHLKQLCRKQSGTFNTASREPGVTTTCYQLVEISTSYVLTGSCMIK